MLLADGIGLVYRCDSYKLISVRDCYVLAEGAGILGQRSKIMPQL